VVLSKKFENMFINWGNCGPR